MKGSAINGEIEKSPPGQEREDGEANREAGPREVVGAGA